jgi:uncharacterized membrane protein YfcA
MGLLAFALYAALGVAAGLLIGCVGVGGVILVPALVYLAGVPIHTAIAAAMGAFLVSGVVGLYVFAKAGSIRWNMTAWLCVGAVPAAFAGAKAANAAPPNVIELAVGALTAAAGIHAMLSRRRAESSAGRTLSAPTLTLTGAVTGCASAMTGTGGPLVLWPLLVWLEVPILAALGLAQAIQLPLALAATGGNALAGTLDVALSLAIGCGIALGTWAGAKAAHRLPTETLRRLVAVLLVSIGAAILLRPIL